MPEGGRGSKLIFKEPAGHRSPPLSPFFSAGTKCELRKNQISHRAFLPWLPSWRGESQVCDSPGSLCSTPSLSPKHRTEIHLGQRCLQVPARRATHRAHGRRPSARLCGDRGHRSLSPQHEAPQLCALGRPGPQPGLCLFPPGLLGR